MKKIIKLCITWLILSQNIYAIDTKDIGILTLIFGSTVFWYKLTTDTKLQEQTNDNRFDTSLSTTLSNFHNNSYENNSTPQSVQDPYTGLRGKLNETSLQKLNQTK